MIQQSMLAIFALTGLGFGITGHAQEYPSRPIRLIVPFAAGGTSDMVGRLVGAKLGDDLGVTIVVDNRGGAGSTLGTAIAARASADGYTLLVANEAMATHEAAYSKLPYRVLNDLAAVSGIGASPAAVVVSNSSSLKTMGDLVATARKSPGKLDYASGGVGTPGHFAVALLEYVARVTFNHVPFKGGSPSVNATIAGEVQFAVPILGTAVAHTKAGRLRMLAVTGAKRSKAMPEVLTVSEAGVSGYEYAPWFGIFAPSAVPKTVVVRMERAIAKALETQELRDQLSRVGVEWQSLTSVELARTLRADVAKWSKVIHGAGIRLN